MQNSNESQKFSLIQQLESVPTSRIVSLPSVEERFKNLYKTIHPGAKAEAFFEAEKFHFSKLISDSKDLSACTKLSLYGCFMDVAVSGLSFDPSFKHIYLIKFSTNVGTKDSAKWENRAKIMISGQGELLLRIMQGQIKYVDNPVLVYEGDDFSFGTSGGIMTVNHVANLSKRTDKIIAGYLKITRNDDSFDYKVLTAQDMDRIRQFSKDPNSLAWTKGFAGMFEAKLIKHAFKNYPKLRIGANTNFQTDVIEESPQIVSSSTILPEASAPAIQAPIDYGADEDFAAPTNAEKAPVINHANEDEF